MQQLVDVEAMQSAWQAFHHATEIGAIRDAAHYDRMSERLDTLWEETRGEDSHPLWPLCQLVGDLVLNYETSHYKVEANSGIEALRFLMLEHGLGLDDLPEIGNHEMLAHILSAERELELWQIRALSRRFGVNAATFIE